jgi:hypothetical protein
MPPVTYKTRPLRDGRVSENVILRRTNDESEFKPSPDANQAMRLKYLATRLHDLGPKPLWHFLQDIERGASLRPTLEAYAALPADFIREHGGDQFAEPFLIEGGRR